QAPTASRVVFGKGDHADPDQLLKLCADTGIAVHFFCMVGHPGTTREDAWRTVEYLLDHRREIDTADMIGFHLDRGTAVSGIRPRRNSDGDWRMALPFECLTENILTEHEIAELEAACKEMLWNEVPQMLHPLYRLQNNWSF